MITYIEIRQIITSTGSSLRDNIVLKYPYFMHG